MLGQIGTGKTAVAASVIQNQPEVRAFHLVSKEDEQTQNHRRCVLSLAYQLTTQLPDYAAFLQQGDQPLEEIVSVSCVAELVHSLLVVPLNAIAQPSTVPLVILIDGLDAFQDSNAVENCFVSSLAAAVRNLPPWVRWVLTSREDPSVMQKLQGLVPQVALDKCGHQTRDDMLKYLQLALVQFVANADKDVPAATLRFIVERSEGLFLYASHIVNALSQKRLTLDKLESFPVGMGGYLRQYFEDQFTAPYYENELKPFHTSVFEWLEDAHAAGRFFVCAAYEHGRLLIGWLTNLLRNGHERIGLWAWNQYDTVLRATTDISNIKCAIYRLYNIYCRMCDTVQIHECMDGPCSFELEPNESNADLFDELRAPIYIIRHALNHLHLAKTERSIECMQKFSSDENFQLARRLARLRDSGLERYCRL
ncbi:hypothetical protein DYB35_001398 [Aphanomyces astaci]|uniref:Nephrocystin 3-like N-terminal domain-containing protein n=1 Tax=Aphanomyces astaci TaxID=112090 RepID=A0A418CJU5_APHAT|nr:hypothetical protein DYB35_001398 [Aphanomyces astaci]